MKYVRISAIFLLAFLSAGAIWGGLTLIANAHGNPFGLMPQSFLQFSPFHSYLIPGMILLVANGLLPLWVLVLVALRRRLSGLWMAVQGCVLLGFLAAECWMLRVVVWPHVFYGAVGLLLIVIGLLLHRGSAPGLSVRPTPQLFHG